MYTTKSRKCLISINILYILLCIFNTLFLATTIAFLIVIYVTIDINSIIMPRAL